jgi:1-acyl-sn-glycerol-3-phosphate acyltransferase
MDSISPDNGTYLTPPVQPALLSRLLPSLWFYTGFLGIVYRAAQLAKRRAYDQEAWGASSLEVLRRLERGGIRMEVTGLQNVAASSWPVVFIGNHLSVMETVVLPSLLLPYGSVTYVIKQSLLDVPVFKHVMRSCRPIAVTRTNPRQDLKLVLEEGGKRLQEGCSIIIFPQTTRTAFHPEQFSTIGVKLAKKTGMPIIPIALCTDAWGNGRWLKDFGKIRPRRRVRFAFGEPLAVTGKGSDEHEAVIDFIQQHLHRWQEQDRR